MAHVPASPGARYGRQPAPGEHPVYRHDPPGYGNDEPAYRRDHGGYGQDQPAYRPGQSYYHQPAQTSMYGEAGWDAPTHTVSSAYATQERPPERGLPGWGAVLVLIVIAAIGGAIDMISGSNVRGGFNIGVVVAAVVAILVVRRSAMFPVVVAPPLVYFAASAIMLYGRSSGLHDRKVLLDAAANWLVYGFPAIAGATAAVLIIAGIRLFSGR